MPETRETDPPIFADPIAPLRIALRGHYEIGRQIGQGAYATVYLARDLKHERQVALKVLNADPTSDTGEIRFIREIRTLARLQHPNILPLHDSGHVECLLYYVMPYVSGETVRDRINRDKQLSVQLTCAIGRETADALAYAHGEGVVHRDIKPENILLSATHPIISDFGIARIIDVAGVKQLTKTGMGSPGTPAYMSPEQLMGERQIDGRSDIYSLGCVLYEMLTGSPPFAGKVGFVKRFTEPPPSVSSTRGDLPRWVDDALTVALQKNPQDRYPTAKEFIAALCAPGSNPDDDPSFAGYSARAEPLRASAGAGGTSDPPSMDAMVFAGGVKYLPEASHPKWRFPGSRGTVIGVVLALVVVGLALKFARPESLRFGGSDSQLDSSRVVILPFRGNEAAGTQIARDLQDAWGNWQDMNVASDLQVAEVMRDKRLPSSLADATDIARRLGARRLVWGEISGMGSAARAKGELYDLADDASPSPRTVVINGAGRDHDGLVSASLALLKNPQRPSLADGGDGRTHSFAAWNAYGNGHIALAQWNLPQAEKEFAQAVASDPNYGPAHVWLTQLGAWVRPESSDWHVHANRAIEGAGGLTPYDSLIATAVASLSTGNYPTACRSYTGITKRFPLDFRGWYGLGECQRLDQTVVRNSSSPSGWSFRSSQENARRMYLRALQLEPNAHALLTFAKLQELLPTVAGKSRIGYRAGADSMVFAADPSFAGDTLAFVPYPLAEFAAIPVSATLTHNAALERNSELLVAFATEWTKQFPNSADAYEALADILEARGDVADSRAGRPSALAAILRARDFSSDSHQRLRLAARESRLRFKRGEFARSANIADSLLKQTRNNSEDGRELIGLAAMTGRIALTGQLSRSDVWRPTIAQVTIAPPLMDAAAKLFANAALGVCGAPTESLEQELENQLQAYVAETRRNEIRASLADRSFSMMAPCTGAQSALRILTPVDRLHRMQRAFARNDLRTVRATFDSLATMRRSSRPGDLTMDYTYQEAWLRSAMGDTAAAIRQLDLALGALPTLSSIPLKEPGAAAAVGRAMALRTDLAIAQHDTVTARQWASALVKLWVNSDRELQPTVARMRGIAGLTR